MKQHVFKEHLKNRYLPSLTALPGSYGRQARRSFFSRARAFSASTVILIALLFSPVFAVETFVDSVAAMLNGSDLKAKYAALESLKSNRTLEAAQLIARTATSEKDMNFRLTVLDDVASRGVQQVVPQITPLLKDPAVAIRQRTARVLGMLGGRVAEKSLATALGQETDANVKAAILQGLSYCGSAQSVPAIKASLKDSHAHVRANGVAALDRIPGDAAKSALDNAADDKDKNVRKLLQDARRKRTKTK